MPHNASTNALRRRVGHDSSKFYNSRLYRELQSAPEVTTQNMAFPQQLLNQIIHGTCERMQELPDNCLHLMITSPPYNVSKEYDTDLSLKEYLDLLQRAFREVYRVLVDGGRACINVCNLGRKPCIPIPHYVSKMMIDIGFKMRGEVVWDKKFSGRSSTSWGSWKSASNPTLRNTHESILILSKGNYKRERTKEEKQGKKDTITGEQFSEWTGSIWTMKTESARRIGHPAPFPVELPYRLVQLYSFTGDIVLDPFMGSGTTAIAALQSERKYVGYEINQEYIDLSIRRIRRAEKKLGTMPELIGGTKTDVKNMPRKQLFDLMGHTEN